MHRRKTHTLLQLYMHSYTYMCVRVCVWRCAYNEACNVLQLGTFDFYIIFWSKARELCRRLSLRIVVQSLNRGPHIVYVCMYVHTYMYVRV